MPYYRRLLAITLPVRGGGRGKESPFYLLKRRELQKPDGTRRHNPEGEKRRAGPSFLFL